MSRVKPNKAALFRVLSFQIYLHQFSSLTIFIYNTTLTYRYGAGGNASAHTGGVMSARKLEETDELKHAKVDKSLSKAIMQARTAKKMTQKELATAINEKPQVVGEYESGKAIPNPQIISKLERKLGCKLPRPGKKPAAKKRELPAVPRRVVSVLGVLLALVPGDQVLPRGVRLDTWLSHVGDIQ